MKDTEELGNCGSDLRVVRDICQVKLQNHTASTLKINALTGQWYRAIHRGPTPDTLECRVVLAQETQVVLSRKLSWVNGALLRAATEKTPPDTQLQNVLFEDHLNNQLHQQLKPVVENLYLCWTKTVVFPRFRSSTIKQYTWHNRTITAAHRLLRGSTLVKLYPKNLPQE